MKRSTIADFITYSAMVGTIYELIRPRSQASEILRLKIDARIKELKVEELRLVAMRAYIIELWCVDEESTRESHQV